MVHLSRSDVERFLNGPGLRVQAIHWGKACLRIQPPKLSRQQEPSPASPARLSDPFVHLHGTFLLPLPALL